MTTVAREWTDLRFGSVPVPDAAPGYLPAAHAQALMAPGLYRWNGSLIVAGTLATSCSNAIQEHNVLDDSPPFLAEMRLMRYGFVAFGYDLVPQAPFAWAAFDKLVRTVERGGSLSGRTRTADAPEEVV